MNKAKNELEAAAAASKCELEQELIKEREVRIASDLRTQEKMTDFQSKLDSKLEQVQALKAQVELG